MELIRPETTYKITCPAILNGYYGEMVGSAERMADYLTLLKENSIPYTRESLKAERRSFALTEGHFEMVWNMLEKDGFFK